MDTPEPTPRRRSNLPAITILAFLVVVACLVGWKWAESYRRDQLLEELKGKGALYSIGIAAESGWSTNWPFYNVETLATVALIEGAFDDDDVRRLRQAFPDALILKSSLDDEARDSFESLTPE